MRQWESSSWFEQAQDWISRVLTAYQIHQTGPLRRVSLGLAATVWTVPTSEGELYFKAAAPPRVHEAELVARIAPVSRGHVPTPLAVETTEGWMLSPSIGTSLAGDSRMTDLEHTRRVFSDAAELQLALSDSAEKVAEGGLPGMLPDYVPEYLEEALTTHASLPHDHPLHISARDADLLLQGMDTVKQAAALLQASPVPATLQQGTLAPEQVLVPSSHRAPVMFVGWGSARWAHPFELVGTAVDQLCTAYQCEPGDEPVRAIVSAYLEPFTRFAPQEALEDLLAPALLLSHAQRHETLMDLLLAADPEDQVAAGPEVMALLALALAAPPAARRGPRAHGSRAQGSRGQGTRGQGSRAQGGRAGRGRNDRNPAPRTQELREQGPRAQAQRERGAREQDTRDSDVRDSDVRGHDGRRQDTRAPAARSQDAQEPNGAAMQPPPSPHSRRSRRRAEEDS